MKLIYECEGGEYFIELILTSEQYKKLETKPIAKDFGPQYFGRYTNICIRVSDEDYEEDIQDAAKKRKNARYNKFQH